MKKVVIIAPHVDDDIYSCMSVIISAMKKEIDLTIHYVTHSAAQIARYAVVKEEFKNYPYITVNQLNLFKDGDGKSFNRIDGQPVLDKIISETDVAFIPATSHHQDHEVINEMCVCALRRRASIDHLEAVYIYEYMYNSDDVPSDMYLPMIEGDLVRREDLLRAIDKVTPILSGTSVNSIKYINQMSSIYGLRSGLEYADSFKVYFQKLKIF